MRVRRFLATAALVTVSMGVTAGTAYADPGALVSGDDHGVRYDTAVTDDGAGLTTVLDGGFFEVASDETSVAVLAADGTPIASIPLVYRVGGQQFTIASVLGQDDHAVTLTPQTDPATAVPVVPVALPLGNIDGQQRFTDLLNQSKDAGIAGAGVGAAIGLGLGCVLGLFVGCIPGVVIGAVAGGVIGLYNAGGPALVQAGYDYITVAP